MRNKKNQNSANKKNKYTNKNKKTCGKVDFIFDKRNFHSQGEK